MSTGLPSHDPLIGRRVGNYRVEAKLGSGGMGEVYRAVDLALGRQVALKFLPDDLQSEGPARQQLLREAKTASALEHPNLCTIFQIGETTDGRPFIAMAYYEGETLTARLRRASGPLPLAEAIDIAMQVASGLGEAHASEIVHCDIKPGNLLLSDRGVVKILDFGIARFAGRKTKGKPLGTMPYMSPEQLRQRSIDHRTDIWSLGVVLFQMLTGKRPFRGKGPALRRKILDEPPRTVAFIGPAAPLCRRILTLALEKERGHRYSDVFEMLDDLAKLAQTVAEASPSADGPASSETLVRSRGSAASGHRSGPGGSPSTATGNTGRSSRDGLATGSPHSASVRAVATGSWRNADRTDTRTLGQRGPRLPSIVVAPFQDLSAEKNQEHLCFGLAEELITRLAGLDSLRVATRVPVDDPDQRLEIGRRLAVDYLLEGSVRKAGPRLRIAARLVATTDGTIVWSAKYDRRLDSLFDIQDELAERIVEALRRPLHGREAPYEATTDGSSAGLSHGITGDFAVYDLYLKGRYRWNRRTPEALRQAVDYFTMALAENPRFARAYAGLADSYAMLGIYGTGPPKELMPQARQAAEDALALDDRLAEVYASRGCVRAAWLWDLPGAETDFLRSIELDPRYATARQWLAVETLLPLGRYEDALEQLSRAAELDPMSLPIQTSIGLLFYYAGRTQRAIRELRTILDHEPQALLARRLLALALSQVGEPEEAAALLRTDADRADPGALAALAVVESRGGHRERAWDLLERLMEPSGRTYVTPTLLAQVYVALGEHDLAIRALQRATVTRACDLIWLGVEPIFEPIRERPEVVQILVDMGIRAASSAS